VTESQEQYKARILGYVGARDPMHMLAVAPVTIERLLEGASDELLSRTPAPGRWSIKEILAHLADDELVGAYRIRMILSAPGTDIQAFDQDVWASTGRYASRDAATSMALFRMLREMNLALLRQLSPEEWDRFGMHAERGRESVRDVARYFAGHDVNHIRQIEAILVSR
jgi:hypothetical protein